MGNTGSCFGGRSHAHTSLIQFSADESGCAQLFDLRWPSPGVDRLLVGLKWQIQKCFYPYGCYSMIANIYCSNFEALKFC